MDGMLFLNSMNVIQEEFLLLAERLKLDTQFLSQEFRVESLEFVVKALESKLNTFLTQDLGQIYVGPYIANWQYDKIPIKRLSNSELKTIEGVYKNLFLPDRQIKFIGVDLDDCLYDVTPIRHLLVQKIDNELRVACGELRVKALDSGHIMLNSQLRTQNSELTWALYNAYKDDLEAEDIRKQKARAVLRQHVIASEAKQSHIEEIVERTYCAYKNFSRLDDPDLRALYKPYEGVKDTLRRLMVSGNFIVGILTNGPSKFQRDKINLLGLKEGEHFNFVMVSEDIGIGKPSRKFFELAKQKASQHTTNPLKDEECLILEDQVKNFSGADGWLKVQFLKGYHSNILPSDVKEIPKYGLTDFSILSILLNFEKDSEFQTMAASYFVLKSLLLLLSEIP